MRLSGQKIAILMESDFYEHEIFYYQSRFPEEGAELHFLTRLWAQPSLTFTGHEYKVPFQVGESFENMDDATLRSFAAVIVPSAIVSDRLRYSEDIHKLAPAVEFMRRAFAEPSIVKGIICHGMWLLASTPELVHGRRVVVHNNLIGDARNMGAIYTDQDVVVDGDLVTGRTGGHCHLFARKIIDLLSERRESKLEVRMASDPVPANLERALLAAVEENDLPGVDQLIRSGVDVNRRGPLPLTPLMLAAGRGSAAMVGKLLAAGADVYAIDSTMGATALHFAAQSGVVDIAGLLLDAGAFINMQSATVGLTPLITAIWAKQVPMVRYLLERGAAADIKTHLGGATAFDFVGREVMWTAGFTQPEAEVWGRQIRELLEHQRTDDTAVIGQQALMSAVQAGDLAKVQHLIAAGVDVNEKSPVVANGNDGQTPLLVACFLGHAAIVRALLAAGANPRINDYLLGATPAHKAAYAGRAEALAALREHHQHVEINAQGPFNGYTALHDAIWHGHRDALAVLLDWPGIRFDLRGHDGRTPEELARSLGYVELADMITAKQLPANGRMTAAAFAH